MPHLQKIYDRYKDRGLTMVAINTVSEQTDMIPEWRKKGGYTFPILVGATWESVEQNYGVLGTPGNLLLDADGKILFKHSGYREGAEKTMESEIREMLGLDPFEPDTRTEAKTERSRN